ncbi:hypothetical protein GPL15_11310 [Clostridium sp. MCC353]|uniref:hypothetical protein n=1 Tax=Clostridium sp. MCC353 TaxID=2592646 RepID=UPI001C013D31|nr:hypothetical protein [Clostridium sp. MCC353]MBT9777090.1 hypothetical protein [Clostridium sp. MCC353]
MNKRKKCGFSAILAAALIITTAMPAWAEKEERTPVGEVCLSFASDIEAGESGGSVDVNVESGPCEVDSVEIVGEKEVWSGGDKPKIKVYLSAENGYYFAKTGKNMFGLIGEDAKYVSAHTKNDKETLVLTVRLDELEAGDIFVSGLTWDAVVGHASWEPADGAKKYRVRLVRGNTSLGSIYTTTETSYDLSGLIDREGVYYFKVQAVDGGNNAGDWIESPSLYVKKENIPEIKENSAAVKQSTAPGPGTGKWVQDETGWWYQNADNSFPVNCWQKINNEWYSFDQRGYMQTGWVCWNDKWYYCDLESGAMWAGTTTPDGHRVGNDGARAD